MRPAVPVRNAAQTAMNTTMAATSMEANRSSDSPYQPVDIRLTAVIAALNPVPMTIFCNPWEPLLEDHDAAIASAGRNTGTASRR